MILQSYRYCLALAITAVFLLPNSVLAGTIVRFETIMGDIDVRLFETATPESTDNFLGYVNRGDYTNTLFHRSAPGFVLQGGSWIFDGTSQVEPVNYPRVTSQPPVTNEPVLSNLRGTIAYAKVGPPTGEPPTEETINSATNQWFFNLADNSENLDNQNGGFTVFGQVVGEGMSVVDAIAALPRFGFSGAWNNGPMRNYTSEDFQNFVPVDEDNLVIVESVSVLSLPDGDYDFDGDVDGGDFLSWQRGLGSTLDVSADNNGDAIVDGDDLAPWQANLGGVSSLSALSVPEPTSIALACFGLLAFLFRR